MTEQELLGEVTKICARHRIIWTHYPDSRKVQGFRGFPDIVAVGSAGLMFIELKGPDGMLSPAQQAWSWVLRRAGALWRLYRPGDLESGRIELELLALNDSAVSDPEAPAA